MDFPTIDNKMLMFRSHGKTIFQPLSILDNTETCKQITFVNVSQNITLFVFGELQGSFK